MVARIFGCALLVAAMAVSGATQDDTPLPVPPPPDSTAQDSLPVIDSVADSLMGADSLSVEERALLFEQRREQFLQTTEKRDPSISFFDSLTTYFASERLNCRPQVDRSLYHDAGDFFRFDPSYFVLDHQSTPMRKTVKPYGLPGDRLNLVVNRSAYHPFEHVVEPDGLVDLNDVPTALSSRAYIIPGPAGMLFGGQHAMASLITLPDRPAEKTPETGILVDQGSFEYNYIRGRYSRQFSSSRELDLSIGYRNADGVELARADDAYFYTGRVFWPIGTRHGIRASGLLYDREGWFSIRPDLGGSDLKRTRIDRQAEIALERSNDDQTARMLFGYRYSKQASHLDFEYKGRFNTNGDGVFVSRELLSGESVLRAEFKGDRDSYTDGSESFDRYSSEISFRLIRLNEGWRWAALGGALWAEDFHWLPSAAFALTRDSEKMFVLLSAGLAQRIPSLYERHLRFQRNSVYPEADLNYADQGNPDLQAETELVASALCEYGSYGNSLRLSVTGGTIKDAIQWTDERRTDFTGITYDVFSPVNRDLDFLNATGIGSLSLGDWLRLLSGGAYHWVESADGTLRPYQPEYQIFSGLELHVYWPQKIMHLYAYGELDYVGPYRGYQRYDLGDRVVANAKLSFRIKSFRFHFVFQNVLGTVYEPREYFTNPGRYHYFGITWSFID